MLTVSVWPMRWARDMACRSFWGFQSESKMMTVSAVARLMPRPPARVDSRNAKSVDPGALKCSIACIMWKEKDAHTPLLVCILKQGL